MNPISLRAKIDTLSSAGVQRLTHRFLRQLRARWVYSRIGSLLFPVPEADGNGFGRPSDFEGFDESLAANPVTRKELLEKSEILCRGSFSFLNLAPVDLGEPIDWNQAPAGDPLWKYNLHYGEWALTLAHAFLITQETRFRDRLIRLLADWAEQNPAARSPGWDPYPLSRRLVAWSRVALALREDLAWKNFWHHCLSPSLRQQTQVLAASPEVDLGNNHLIANYRALAWMGLLSPAWPEAPQWKQVGLQGLWEEMRRQILPDGVHDERSISYHTLVLQDLLEIWTLCKAMKEPIPEDTVPTLEGMLQFLSQMQAPDGSYPLLNDTVPNYPADPRSVLLAGGHLLRRPEWVQQGRGGEVGYAAWLAGMPPQDAPEGREKKKIPELSVFPQAGYAVLRWGEKGCLYFDAGPMGPSHLPGHGHADALSFSLFAGGRWLISDPGVFSYHDSSWRDHFRSTRAHNTVAIDGQDQCVFWGPFRVAYPPPARLLDWSEDFVAGEHEGYGRLRDPVVHRRCIREISTGEWEIKDSFLGRGDHDFLFNLQLAPGGHGEVTGLNGEIRWPEGIVLRVTCLSSPPKATAGIEPGWVSPGWNLKEEAPRYVLRWKGRVPLDTRMILKATKE
jgi:hypothetical protein